MLRVPDSGFRGSEFRVSGFGLRVEGQPSECRGFWSTSADGSSSTPVVWGFKAEGSRCEVWRVEFRFDE